MIEDEEGRLHQEGPEDRSEFVHNIFLRLLAHQPHLFMDLERIDYLVSLYKK